MYVYFSTLPFPQIKLLLHPTIFTAIDDNVAGPDDDDDGWFAVAVAVNDQYGNKGIEGGVGIIVQSTI